MLRAQCPRHLGGICLSILISAALLAPAASPAEEMRINGDASAVTVLTSTDDEILLEFTLGRFERTPVEFNGETYFEIGLTDEVTVTRVGFPALPQITRSVIIPPQAKMIAQVIESEFVEFHMPVAPAGEEPVRGVLGPIPEPDLAEVYERDAFYPPQCVTLGTPYILRDFRGLSVTAHPFAYNPQSQTLRVYHRLTVKLANAGPDTENIKTRNIGKCDDFFKDIYEHHFINFRGDRYTPIEEYGRMIVIAHPIFLETVQPYVDWKNQKGIPTELYDVTTIGTTEEDIRNFVTDEYNSPEGLTFVQLVGDFPLVPTFLTDIIFFEIHGVSDATYALVEGADTYPDLFVGRFSAETITTLETQIDRTIWYEKEIAGGDWLHKGCGLATVWGEGFGYNGWNGVQSVEVIRTDLLGYLYTEVAQLYEEGTPPFDIIPVEAWEVTEVLEEGVGILNVDGNADIEYLDTGSYTIPHVHMLENDNRLPFIFMAAPWCGNFMYDCFSEAWLLAQNGNTGNPTGAIAVYCCSNALEYAPPQAAMHESTDLLVDDEMNTVGGLWYNGMCFMMDIYGAPDNYNTFENFNILGDASLQVRTDIPVAIDATHDPCILLGQTEFLVNTNVADALVGLSRNGEFIAAGHTDAGGAVTLSFDAFTEPAELTLTITGYNRIARVETVPVLDPSAVPEGAMLVTGLKSGFPNPFNDRTIIHYNLSRPADFAIEIYDIKGQLVRTLVQGAKEAGVFSIEWDGADDSGRSLPSGIYFCRMSAGDTTSTRRLLRLR